MLFEILKFELLYRIKRPETYLFFVFLLTLSVFGADFILQGVELGMVKKNAPIVIGKTMGAITGIFMILTSLIMGMPMIRDDQYQITPFFYALPIKKYEILVGRFLGSFLILLAIFCAIPIGMMLGELLPWHLTDEMLPFNLASYINVFLVIVLPSLFFGAALFFVTGALSRNLLVVYTQGLFLFVLFLLTKAINNDYIQAVLDPFSLTTITQLSKDWLIIDRNTLLIPFDGVLFVNKLFWIFLGILVLVYGYYRFNFSLSKKVKKSAVKKVFTELEHRNLEISLPISRPRFNWQSQLKQFQIMSTFYCKSLLKETSFWAIIISAVVIVIVNSINLGTVYGVDSYPTTYFIVEELQELSSYFFIIILLFYSGELYWKEQGIGMNHMSDATPVSSIVIIASKMTGLVAVFIVLILTLILSGIVFQVIKGYYRIDLYTYFTGFFIELLPFLLVYTFVTFFIQALVNNKFLGILTSLLFFIVSIASEPLGFYHVLLNYGGNGLQPYSELNGYGHFMLPYLWLKLYWFLFGILLLIVAASIANRGVEVKFMQRLKNARANFSRKAKALSSVILLLFIFTGSYIYYQTNLLNQVWSDKEENNYRADYEKTLKQFEYQPQVNIIAAELILELYPDKRAYELVGNYTLKNETSAPIDEIHIQKQIEEDVMIDSLLFSASGSLNHQYERFDYSIYQLENPLYPGDSMKMTFKQTLRPRGFNMGTSISTVLGNGTFIRNNEFPTISYNRKYELSDEKNRELNGLPPRASKAEIDDHRELQVARTGSDSHGLVTNVIVGTEGNQTAISSGKLLRKWIVGNRNYFEYQSTEPIINFYAILSGQYELIRENWNSETSCEQKQVCLEIYYHPTHSYNVDRMMKGMKVSLDYYTENFSPYQYEQLRIVEFPRYHDFAQSFPNTIPFSESIGFILDIDDSTDVDMTFFVTAHEVAHQWWGMQVEAANVKGRNFILETLSQYSALMVLKNQYSRQKLNQFLALQKELYDKAKLKAKEDEVPLYVVGNEEYIYYNKGAIAMYKLQELICEDELNNSLRSFIKDWNSKNGILKHQLGRYATSEDLIHYILQNTLEKNKSEVLKLLKEL